MNGCCKQPPLTCPAISANMQLRAVNRLATYQPDYHSVFYAIFRVYTNHEKEPYKFLPLRTQNPQRLSSLYKYNFCINNCYCSISETVNSLYPLHLIFCFERFGYALTFCHLFYKPKKHIFSLSVNVGEVSVQLTTELQIGEQRSSVFSQIIQVPLSPYTDMHLFFLSRSFFADRLPQ